MRTGQVGHCKFGKRSSRWDELVIGMVRVGHQENTFWSSGWGELVIRMGQFDYLDGANWTSVCQQEGASCSSRWDDDGQLDGARWSSGWGELNIKNLGSSSSRDNLVIGMEWGSHQGWANWLSGLGEVVTGMGQVGHQDRASCSAGRVELVIRVRRVGG